MSFDRGLDRLLDRAIVPGYSRIGYAVRRRAWPKDDPAADALRGCRVVVTGAGRGLGEATARGLARLGATVHLVVRNTAKAEPALERIASDLDAMGQTPDLHVDECDVADLTSVRRFARQLSENLDTSGQALDAIVHNAGVMPAVRTVSPEGNELSMATHVLGPILMTELLLPALARSERGARRIFVSSGGQYTQKLESEDLKYEADGYRGSVAYARSKRVQVELTPLLAKRWTQSTAVYAMHPGWAATPGVADALPGFHALTRPLLRSAESGADTAVWLAATDPEPATGTFWHDRQQRPSSYTDRTKPSPEQIQNTWAWIRASIALT